MSPCLLLCLLSGRPMQARILHKLHVRLQLGYGGVNEYRCLNNSSSHPRSSAHIKVFSASRCEQSSRSHDLGLLRQRHVQPFAQMSQQKSALTERVPLLMWLRWFWRKTCQRASGDGILQKHQDVFHLSWMRVCWSVRRLIIMTSFFVSRLV